jgi:hypothetical protein
VAKPNQQSAAVALNLAQTAGLCRDYELRENAIKLLATRGDAKAQRILATFIFSERRRFVTDTTTPIWANKDKAEGMAWYGRAGAQGDLFADKANTNHVWTDGERVELGFWILRNCPTLC